MPRKAISRIWRALGFKPCMVETSQLSAGLQFIEKAREVVDLYLDPPQKLLVPCVHGLPAVRGAGCSDDWRSDGSSPRPGPRVHYGAVQGLV
jgi:hypothetical protein